MNLFTFPSFKIIILASHTCLLTELHASILPMLLYSNPTPALDGVKCSIFFSNIHTFTDLQTLGQAQKIRKNFLNAAYLYLSSFYLDEASL